MAGLTSAAYLSKAGYKVLLCEKAKKTGGLVNSFTQQGFTFDGGIRAIENSGIVLPMLSQLGIDIDFVKSPVSIGIENDQVRLSSKASLHDYQKLLVRQFPDHAEDVARIILAVERTMQQMDILYGIDNPLFHDLKQEREYVFKTVLPWLVKYLMTIGKAMKNQEPIEKYLGKLTDNQSLIDMIAQHFFQDTPAYFALSYFSLYLDYRYPKGGTGVIAEKLERFFIDHQGELCLSCEIDRIDPEEKRAFTTDGRVFSYKKLIWTGDQKRLYKAIDMDTFKSSRIQAIVQQKKMAVMDKHGGDSILSVFLTTDFTPDEIEKSCGPHAFYTPVKKGLHGIDIRSLKMQPSGSETDAGFTRDKAALFDWIRQYEDLTTYEISCPVLRDASLAPHGKSGLIVSTLMDFSLVRHFSQMGWYEEFKSFSASHIIKVLDNSLLPGLKDKVISWHVSTPLTIERLTGNTEGAITGWAFTNNMIPAESRFKKINHAVETPVPDIFQAGQWTFSPSGLPVSILTGKLAADAVKSALSH